MAVADSHYYFRTFAGIAGISFELQRTASGTLRQSGGCYPNLRGLRQRIGNGARHGGSWDFPIFPGLWWIHLVMLGFVFWLLRKYYGKPA